MLPTLKTIVFYIMFKNLAYNVFLKPVSQYYLYSIHYIIFYNKDKYENKIKPFNDGS